MAYKFVVKYWMSLNPIREEVYGSSSNDYYLSPLIAILKSIDNEKLQTGCEEFCIFVKKSEKLRQTLIRN
ncbi:MAG: hypothetical protein EZS28_000762 [Streblomastix strix]|uniref:Uncharacterized protein n=1 Tax=Streblomastix strix TaxID=222440 RepID=A0A5J4XB61_9EUKA|nr:MAG: hypothetical protein EZS28_000762 [Streblomastix strix]